MKKNNLILGTFLAITAILFSSCGASSSSDSTSTENIGSQVWTSKNLDVTTYRNGDVIPQVEDEDAWAKLTTGAWCYYNNDASNGTKYGKLYNKYAVNDPRGLAPEGFHIPSDSEWIILTDNLGGESEAGTKMKSTSGWYNNGNGTNSSGFSGLPGGLRGSNGTFMNVDAFGYWWSSTEITTSKAWSREMYYESGSLDRDDAAKRDGFSVRCLRD
jgi:uncharacterized protein (TIGR02145 family)